MWDYKTPSDEWVYLYTADDERAWSYKTDNTSLWTLRSPDAKVLREYSTNGTWSVEADSIYRNGLLLATETPQGTRHLHLDHLGTPRLISDTFGHQNAYHVYYPYGEEATAFNQDTVREKFTGHERDLGNPAGAGDDLDYMHARFCSPLTGRFSSVDPSRESVVPTKPLSWNRYSYAVDNPVKFVDPDGRIWDYALDIVGIGFDVYELYKQPSWGKAGWLAVDVVLAAAPFVPTRGAIKAAEVGIDAFKGSEAAAEVATGFAKGTARSALTEDRLQHASDHLIKAGLLPNWNKGTAEKFVQLAQDILEKPSKTFDYALRGGESVRGFAGKIDGKNVVIFVYKTGKDQGKVATAIVPSVKQVAAWGLSAK